MARMQGKTGRGPGLGVAVLLAAAILGAGAAPGQAGEKASAAPPKARLAVLPFSGPAAGVPEGFGQALAQAVRYGLEQVRGVRLVDSAGVLEAAQRLNLSLEDRLADEPALRLGRELTLRGLVTGSYELAGETLTLRARLVDLAGREQIVLGEEIADPLGEFLATQGRVTREILRRLQLPVTEPDGRRLQAAFTGHTASLAAYTQYAQGAWLQGLGTREAHDQAAVLLGKALEADQNFALGHFALGVSLRATNNRWKASGEFRKAIQLDPNFAAAYKSLGDLLVSSPRRLYDQAIQAYQKAVELWPDYAEAMVGLGDARQAKGQFDEAIQEYQRALALEPENARVHFGMGKIYYGEKQLYHEAVAEYQRAIALEPAFIEAHLSLGDLYEEKGLYREAIARYRHVLSIDPRHPGATYGLALAYERVDVPRAIQEWERYIELASTLQSEREWVDIARKHLEKLRREGKQN